MTERNIGCEAALRALAAYLDGELGGEEQGDVSRHLETCQSCYSRAEFERRMGSHLAALGQRAPEPAFQDRIRQLLADFTDQPADEGK